MKPDPKREFLLHAYVVAHRARAGDNPPLGLERLKVLADALPPEDPLTKMAQSVAARFLRDVRKDPKHQGDNLAAAVDAYIGEPKPALQPKTFDWQRRADLQ